MNYEVEQKFAVRDQAELLQKLDSIQIEWGETHRQEDAYFNHPLRDFAETDEALRVRLDGPESLFTYKGPRVDSATKTRQEMELQVVNAGTDGEAMKQFLTALGFTYVHSVIKQRRKGKLCFQNRIIEVALDDVQGLGCYVELELVVPEQELEEATTLLNRLADSLGLTEGITTGYLDMLLR